jgi:hypothetical protein
MENEKSLNGGPLHLPFSIYHFPSLSSFAPSPLHAFAPEFFAENMDSGPE